MLLLRATQDVPVFAPSSIEWPSDLDGTSRVTRIATYRVPKYFVECSNKFVECSNKEDLLKGAERELLITVVNAICSATLISEIDSPIAT